VLKNKNPNIEILAIAVERLGKLIDDVVFPGGCATGLLLTDQAAPSIRATRDVDVMVEVASLAGYHSFNEKLRRRGFKEGSSPAAPICRWQSERIILDVMPTDPELLGFGQPMVCAGVSGQPVLIDYLQAHPFGYCPLPIFWRRRSRRSIIVVPGISFSAGMSKMWSP
jgi:hypothetical protein